MKIFYFTTFAVIISACSGSDQILTQTQRCNINNYETFIYDNEKTTTLIRESGHGCYLRDVDLREADLKNADLRRVDLSDAYLFGADLRGVDLSGANGRDANFNIANLVDADLRGADLSLTVLNGANLSDADLNRANLRGSYLIGVDLRGASLIDADLRGAFLISSDLRGADLSDADLRGVILRPDSYLANLNSFRINIESRTTHYLINDNLSATKYDSKTRFPRNFSPEKHGMIKVE